MSSFEQNFVNGQLQRSDTKKQKVLQEDFGYNKASQNAKSSMSYNNSSIFRDKQSMDNRSQLRESMAGSKQSVIVDDENEVVLEKLQKKNINFIQESDFKKDSQCFICQQVFGNFVSRQHHCRLCANTVCDPCSMKRVNDTRVCDLCFYKLKNLSGERRKKELLQTTKTYINQIAQQIISGQKYIEELQKKIQEREQETNKKEQEIQNFKNEKEIELQLLEEENQSILNQIKNCDTEYKEQQQILKNEKNKLEEIESDLNIVDTQYDQVKTLYNSKYETYALLKQRKITKEGSEDFQRLPNYFRAKKYDSIPLSEAIISLDQQYPPDDAYEQKYKQQEDLVYSNNIKNQGQTTYEKEIENNNTLNLKQKVEMNNKYEKKKKNYLCG